MGRRYGLPILIILLTGISLNTLGIILSGDIGSKIIIILRCVLMFVFGLNMYVGRKKRNQSWIKKLVISFFLIFFLVWDLGFVMIPELKTIFNFLGIKSYVIYLVYIYCGYAFYD
jgi:hypothetical protein